MRVGKDVWKQLNEGWPEGMVVPSDADAIRGVKRLFRLTAGEAWKHSVRVVHHKARRTCGQRTPRGRVLIVSPDYCYPKPGWPAIVHDLSHFVHHRVNPGLAPHAEEQACIELEMQRIVIEELLS